MQNTPMEEEHECIVRDLPRLGYNSALPAFNNRENFKAYFKSAKRSVDFLFCKMHRCRLD